MNRKTLKIVVALTLMLSGCEKKPASPVTGMAGKFSRAQSTLATVYAGAPRRYIAESDRLEVITPESDLQKSWQSAVSFCGTIRCEVLSSSITTRAGDSIPAAELALRVTPEDLEKLAAYVEKLGKIAQRTTQREDKTTQVVDTEAKIKNLTSFRDNLRAMLAKSSATVRDLVE